MRLILILICLIPSLAFGANIYVDSICAAGAAYDQTTRTQGGGSDVSYQTIQAAVTAMSGGDDIYVRGGTYNETVTIPVTKDGSAGNYSSLQSYPGEWAIIDASGIKVSGNYVVGLRCYDKGPNGICFNKYWEFSRLEITGGANAGFFLSGGPFLIRYCYIHDNRAAGGGDNPAGITGMVWYNGIVEYNWFEDNGCDSISGSSNCSAGIFIHSDYAYVSNDWRTNGWWDQNSNGVVDPYEGIQNTTVRYNIFSQTGAYATHGYGIKEQQHWAALRTAENSPLDDIREADLVHKDRGDKVHHNIFLNDLDAMVFTDFIQYHHNIHDGGGNVTVGYVTNNLFVPVGATVYNNTIDGGILKASYGEGYDPGDTANEHVPMFTYLMNNIVANAGSNSYTCSRPVVLGCENYTGSYQADDFIVDHNYLYSTGVDRIGVLHSSSANKFDGTTASFNSAFGTTNYYKATSEGSDNLFAGASGADQYITRGAHVVSSPTTIANGGYNAAHPYLSGVTIPDYIGATDPDDITTNNWVDGLLNDLTSTTWLRSTTTDRDENDDPTWIADSDGSSPSTPTITGVMTGIIR